MLPFNIYIYSVFDKNYLLFVQSSIESIEKTDNNKDVNALTPKIFTLI